MVGGRQGERKRKRKGEIAKKSGRGLKRVQTDYSEGEERKGGAGSKTEGQTEIWR